MDAQSSLFLTGSGRGRCQVSLDALSSEWSRFFGALFTDGVASSDHLS